MFRRREDSLDNPEADTDLLARADDDAIDTSVIESSSSQETPATAQSAATSAPAASAAAPAAAAKPAPTAAAFRPQPAPNLSATRSPIPSAEPRSSNIATSPSSGAAKASKRILTVGNDIHMKGEISTCDRLVIEGSVDAELKDVHTVELAETGSFKGTAEIEDAEISGIFEGDLIVNGRLIIYATGQVRGNIAYGEIEIERGGQLSGTIKSAAQAKAESKNAKIKVA